MSWRYKGRTKPNPRAPRARAVCDRCNMNYQHYDLQWQYDYRGDQLTNTRFLVCRICLDKPYQGRRPVLLPPDPLPIRDPRVEPLVQEEGAPQSQYVQPQFTNWDQPGFNWDNGVTEWLP